MTKEELESIELIPKLINALRETTAERDQWKVQAESAANFIEHLQSHLMVKTYDCDGWKARAEALERALYKQCYTCTLFVIDKGCILKDRPCECDNRQFDEARFAGGRDRHE